VPAACPRRRSRGTAAAANYDIAREIVVRVDADFERIFGSGD
jgi:hypothetical protein